MGGSAAGGQCDNNGRHLGWNQVKTAIGMVIFGAWHENNDINKHFAWF